MVSIRAEKKKNRYQLDIRGHAGYNPGNDIVCASVSILAYTMAQEMQELDDLGLFRNMECLMEEGNVHIVAEIREARGWRFDALFHTILTGFELLNNRYPQNVHLDWVGE